MSASSSAFFAKFNLPKQDADYETLQAVYDDLIKDGDIHFYSVNQGDAFLADLPLFLQEKEIQLKGKPLIWIKGDFINQEYFKWNEVDLRYAIEFALPKKNIFSYSNIKPGALITSDNEDDIDISIGESEEEEEAGKEKEEAGKEKEE